MSNYEEQEYSNSATKDDLLGILEIIDFMIVRVSKLEAENKLLTEKLKRVDYSVSMITYC